MSVETLLLGAGFAGILTAPLLPGALEILRPRDNRPLRLDEGPPGPRARALAFRRVLAPLLRDDGPEPWPRTVVLPPPSRPRRGSRPAVVEVHATVRHRAGSAAPTILVALGDAEVEPGSALTDLYAQTALGTGFSVRARKLAADGDLSLGPDSTVLAWLDAGGNARIGARCWLGPLATAAGTLLLGRGTRFTRLWGSPITTAGAPTREEGVSTGPVGGGDVTIERQVVWAQRRLSLPGGFVLARDLVVYGGLRLGPECVVHGSVKAYGPVFLDPKAEVRGNIVGRHRVRLEAGARVSGHIFADGDVSIGLGALVGRAGTVKSVVSLRGVRLGPGVTVHGWIAARRGGLVV